MIENEFRSPGTGARGPSPVSHVTPFVAPYIVGTRLGVVLANMNMSLDKSPVPPTPATHSIAHAAFALFEKFDFGRRRPPLSVPTVFRLYCIHLIQRDNYNLRRHQSRHHPFIPPVTCSSSGTLHLN
jgi:hypothetical protein